MDLSKAFDTINTVKEQKSTQALAVGRNYF